MGGNAFRPDRVLAHVDKVLTEETTEASKKEVSGNGHKRGRLQPFPVSSYRYQVNAADEAGATESILFQAFEQVPSATIWESLSLPTTLPLHRHHRRSHPDQLWQSATTTVTPTTQIGSCYSAIQPFERIRHSKATHDNSAATATTTCQQPLLLAHAYNDGSDYTDDGMKLTTSHSQHQLHSSLCNSANRRWKGVGHREQCRYSQRSSSYNWTPLETPTTITTPSATIKTMTHNTSQHHFLLLPISSPSLQQYHSNPIMCTTQHPSFPSSNQRSTRTMSSHLADEKSNLSTSDARDT